MAKHNYGGVYANMDFPPYEYVPYPRHVKTGPASDQYEVAYNEEDEAKIKARLKKAHDDAPAETEAFLIDPEKEILISRARELNVPINRKWSKQKLEQVLKLAEQEIDDLPPEDDSSSDQTNLFPNAKENVSAQDYDEEDKDELIAQAKALGYQATRLWGIPRLKASIAEGKAE